VPGPWALGREINEGVTAVYLLPSFAGPSSVHARAGASDECPPMSSKGFILSFLPRRVISRYFGLALACLFLLLACSDRRLSAQGYTGPIPYLNTGPDAMAGIDFATFYVEQQNRDFKNKEKREQERKRLIESGTLSALDLDAPNSAIQQYNEANTLLKQQKSKDAIPHLQKAIANYPKFVAAHMGLGLAYLNEDDTAHAKAEFETAARLDDKFAASFVNLGRLALSTSDPAAAKSNLDKAASLRPKDPMVLSLLAYAEQQNHDYPQVLDLCNRVHALDHKGMANIHYVAAAAAESLNDPDLMETQLKIFISEDPTNAFAPAARKNLDIIAHNREVKRQLASVTQPSGVVSDSPVRMTTIPNSDRLKAQLHALESGSPGTNCNDCVTSPDSAPASTTQASVHLPGLVPEASNESNGIWTIRKSVDQVTLFFAVSHHGHMVNDLQSSDFHISDDNKPPEQVIEFAPQSKLPLRVALLVDTSGSVHNRFSFEKRSATHFIQKILTNPSDLAFVAGFSTGTAVTQDFTSDPALLAAGVDRLSNEGGTALFDAVTFACWKLAEYPDSDRVANVVVVLSDGEDNSSHTSLKQTIQVEERTGVTVYAISTREDIGDKTDADKILEALAERSGGEAMFPHDAPTLSASFNKLRNVIRSRYFIAYKPANFVPDGRYRFIHVMGTKNGQHFKVRTRQGYYARLEGKPN
jgi:Ca-activated chloride channel family protein